MKQVTLGLVSGLIIIIFAVILINLNSKADRKQQLTDNLAEAVEETAQSVFKEKNYDVNDNDEFIADFLETLLSEIDSDGTLTVNVVEADLEKGILSVDVVEEFKYTNGNTGYVQTQKTIILNQTVEEETPVYTASFYLDKDSVGTDETYKVYTLYEGESLLTPVEPKDITDEGKTFLYWSDLKGNKYTNISGTISSNLKFYAVWG